MSAKPWEKNLSREKYLRESQAVSGETGISSGNPQNESPSTVLTSAIESSASGTLVKQSSETPEKSKLESNDNSDSQALRADQVKNALSFLLNPRVRNTSLQARKEFLMKKGLTTAEIDEAVRQAQPELDRIASATVGGLTSQVSPPVASAVVQSVQTGLAPTSNAITVAPPAQTSTTSTSQLLLTSVAAMSLGAGLALLLKRLLSQGGWLQVTSF